MYILEGHTVFALPPRSSVEGHTVFLLYRHVQVSRGIMFFALPSCACVEGPFFALPSCAIVEGHTVCCFTVKFKCRGAYSLLLYCQVQVSRGILFVALPSCLRVEGHTVFCFTVM